MSRSATPATQSEGGCLKVPRLPRKVQLHVAKCHACHAKSRGVHGDMLGTERATRASPVPYVPRLPREKKWRSMSPRTSCVMKLFTSCVSKYHACHVKRRWMSSSATPATQSNNPCHEVPRQVVPRKQPRRSEGRCHKVATPATQSEGGCHKVPRLPHKVCVQVVCE